MIKTHGIIFLLIAITLLAGCGSQTPADIAGTSDTTVDGVDTADVGDELSDLESLDTELEIDEDLDGIESAMDELDW